MWCYGLTDTDILEMPAHRFFAINKHIEILRAEENITKAGYSNLTEESAKDVMREYQSMQNGVIEYTLVGEDTGELWRQGMQRLVDKQQGG